MLLLYDIQGELKAAEELTGFLPYGVGKRMCPGSNLADMQVCVVRTLYGFGSGLGQKRAGFNFF